MPVDLPRFDVGETEGGGVIRRGVPVRRIGGRLVTTVFDLLMAQYAVARDGLPGEWPTGYDDAAAVHAGLAGGDHVGAGRGGRRGWPASSPATPSCRSGRSMIAMGAGHQPLVPLRPDLPDVLHADHAVRLPGRERRRLGALRRAGEGAPADRVPAGGVRPRLAAADPAHDRHVVLLPAHRPVALRELRRARSWPARSAAACSAARRSPTRSPRRRGWAGRPSHPAFDRNPLDLADEAAAAGHERRRLRRRRTAGRPAALRRRGPGRPGELPAGDDDVAGQPARLLGQGHGVLHAPPARRRGRGARRGVAANGCGRREVRLARRRRRGPSSTWSPRSTSG